MHAKIKQILAAKREDLRLEKSHDFRDYDEGSKQKGYGAFLHAFGKRKMNIIAEVKLASPTHMQLGTFEGFEERLTLYEQGGATALSIITEPHFFKGDTSLVTQARMVTLLPILQKDFVIDPFQIYQARRLGADALLFIARIVTVQELQDFVDLALELGVEPVVEVFNKQDLEKALRTNTRIIAVNARDLDTFTIDKTRAYALLKEIPEEYLKIGFSGIENHDDVLAYQAAGASGVLVGTALMQSLDPEKLLKELQV